MRAAGPLARKESPHRIRFWKPVTSAQLYHRDQMFRALMFVFASGLNDVSMPWGLLWRRSQRLTPANDLRKRRYWTQIDAIETELIYEEACMLHTAFGKVVEMRDSGELE